LTVLKELSANGGCCVSELTKAIHLSQATATGILDRLAKRRFVRRKRSDQDKRRVLVWLTDAGEELLADAPPLLQEEFTADFSKLQNWEQTQILSSLQRLVSMMEAKGIEATPILATGPITATSDDTKAFLGEKPEGTEAGANPSETVGSKDSATAQGSPTRVIRQGKGAP
jgi:DNA-binding MarR family transcriptional regulator